MWLGYEDFKDLPRKIIADKILLDKAFNIVKNLKNDANQSGLASIVYNFFDKKTFNTNKGVGIYFGVVSENEELAEELNKPIIRKLVKQKVHSPFIDNIWGAYLIKEFAFYCALMIFLVNMHGLFL